MKKMLDFLSGFLFLGPRPARSVLEVSAAASDMYSEGQPGHQSGGVV